MKQGAYDYLFKPLDLHQLRPRGRRGAGSGPADARAGRRRRDAAGRRRSGDAIVGSCPAMQEVYKAIGRVADQDVPGADHRRERHRQGAGRPRHLPARPAGQGAVPGAQLRRHPREPAGERAVRPREGRLHRRRPPPHRQVRAVPRRHPLPRRDRRHAAGHCRPRSCACCRSRRSSASAATRRSAPTCG